VSFEKTLDAVYKNLRRFSKAGVENNEVAVITIIDGIENMDKSMDEYFDL